MFVPSNSVPDSWHADACIELAETVGLILDPWQRMVIRNVLAIRPDDRWAAFEVALVISRQNGKNGILEAVQLAKLFLFDDRLQLHTSNKFKSSIEAFIRIRELILNTDALRKRVKRMPTSHGDEGIELFGKHRSGTGPRLAFMARGPGAGRSFSADTIYFDEAYNVSAADIGAMIPTLSSKPNPQLWYTSSAGWEISTQLGSVRNRAIEGDPDDGALAYLEWSVDENNYDPTDRQGWAQANPSLGIRRANGTGLSEEYIAKEQKAMDPVEFARERLGVGQWPVSADSWSVIPKKVWDELKTDAAMVDPVVFALDVTPDRSRTSIAACGSDTDGKTLVELVAHGGGTSWAVDRLKELIEAHPRCRGVAISPRGPAGSLLTDVREMLDGIRKEKLLLTPTAMDEAQACTGLYDAATDSMSLRHRGQAPIATALAGARQKNLSEGAWTWNRKSVTVDISPIWAITLAKWCHENAPKARQPFILVGA
jgi:phage terminase large subunit-like protein